MPAARPTHPRVDLRKPVDAGAPVDPVSRLIRPVGTMYAWGGGGDPPGSGLPAVVPCPMGDRIAWATCADGTIESGTGHPICVAESDDCETGLGAPA
jgi:hypothetical protein